MWVAQQLLHMYKYNTNAVLCLHFIGQVQFVHPTVDFLFGYFVGMRVAKSMVVNGSEL